jgi:uncharacterized membrane protein
MSRILLPLLAVLAAAAPARADDEKFVKLALADGKVLAVADDSEEAGAQVVAAKDGDSQAQEWKVVEDGKFLKLVNRKSGKVLDVNEDSKDEGGKIIIWDEKTEDNDNQRWSWEGEGKARRLKSKSSNLVLDVEDNGNVVQKKADEKAKGQVWTVKDVK